VETLEFEEGRSPSTAEKIFPGNWSCGRIDDAIRVERPTYVSYRSYSYQTNDMLSRGADS
jgi:hypothetical protein